MLLWPLLPICCTQQVWMLVFPVLCTLLLQAANTEAHPEIARAVAYAAGRYLHIMFPENAHEVQMLP